jgi:transposase
MAKGYRPVVRDQGFLLPPDMREWLPPDHAVWLVIRVVEGHLDTGVLDAVRKTGGAGAAGYDPRMLLELLIWAYASGVTSSRRIEALCHQDVAFRVICAQDVPDHSTIARFRQGFAGVVRELFVQVLMLCARLGMGAVGTVALDGTKIAASAPKPANRTGERLRKLAAERAAAHAAADAADDEEFGDARGDEVPAGAADPRTRDERIAAALADLEAERTAQAAEQDAQAQARVRAAAAGAPVRGRRPAAAAAELARLKLDRAAAARQARIEAREQRAAAGRTSGPRPKPPREHNRVQKAAAALEAAPAGQAEREARPPQAARSGAPVRNITDPDSRLMPVRGGAFIQGHNAQNVTSEDGLVTATRLTNDATDYRWYEPMIADAVAAAAMMAARRPSAAGCGQDAAATPGPGPIGLVLADAGYCSDRNLTCAGPDRLIAAGKRRDLEKNARAGGGDGNKEQPGTAIAATRARLATEDGITACRRRGHIAETPHGDIKHNTGLRHLSLRGIRKAAAEWTFACAVRNLRNAISTGRLTHATLATLPR